MIKFLGMNKGCIMLPLDTQINRNLIDVDDLYPDEKVKDDHITLIYGINTIINSVDKVWRIVSGIKAMGLEIDAIPDYFDNPEYDVLILKVIESPVLNLYHHALRSSLPGYYQYHTYNPHITVGYLKKSIATKYLSTKFASDSKVLASRAVYSIEGQIQFDVALTRNDMADHSSGE